MAIAVFGQRSQSPSAYNAARMTSVAPRGAGVPAIAGSIAIASGLLVLAGWVFGIHVLKQPMDTAANMQPATAAALIAIGVSLWLHTQQRFKTAAAAVGLTLAGVCVLALALLVPHFSFDRHWLESTDPITGMTPLTALGILAVGIALALSTRSTRAWIAHLLTLWSLLVATIVTIGYIFRVSNLVGVGGYTSVAPHTAVLMIIVCVGVLFLQPTHGVMAVFTSDTMGGKMARQILPATILIPIGLGWLRLEGERAGLYDPQVGPPLLIVGTMILLSIVVWLNARTIATVDAKRQDVEEALRRSNESREARVVVKTAQLAESRAVAAESAEMFFQLFEFAPDALIAVDSNGRIDRTNIRALELFGYERPELLGRPVEILVPERFATQHVAHRSAFLEAPHAKTMGPELEIAARRKDGSEFPVEIVLSPANSPQGPLVLAVIHDLTERRRTEALTRAAEERIQTGQRMEALGQLAGGVAHDFNNMMTVVTGYSELLLARTADDHPSRKALEEIKKAGDRCANLTGHLLAFSRRQVLTPTVVDIGSIVTDLNQMMPVLLGENIQVHLSVEPNVWHVRTDQAQIEQVIVNLVVNARDAMPKGGKLAIAVWNRDVDLRAAAVHPELAIGSYVVLSVADTGHGMDEHTRARVFDPFFTTKPVGQGSGLGLSPAYGFIKQSGGHIYLESQPGSGTTVHVYLPRAESTPDASPASRAQIAPGGHETILLAEDEGSVRSFVRDVLGQAGYRLLEASDGRSALQLAAAFNGPIHLLISDVVMPGMNGGDLAETLMAGRPRTKTLLISGYVQQLVDEVAVARAGVAFLRKPFSANDLLTRVREILDARDNA